MRPSTTSPGIGNSTEVRMDKQTKKKENSFRMVQMYKEKDVKIKQLHGDGWINVHS